MIAGAEAILWAENDTSKIEQLTDYFELKLKNLSKQVI